MKLDEFTALKAPITKRIYKSIIREFFSWCEANAIRLLAGDQTICRTAIEHCVRAKARFVAADPDDTSGTRALLNFGHTFGHAIEAVAGDAILHGEAVALGLTLAFEYSALTGCCQLRDAARVRSLFNSAGLATSLAEIGLATRAPDIFTAMRTDKKAGSAGLTLILARGIGRAFGAKGVNLEQLEKFLDQT